MCDAPGENTHTHFFACQRAQMEHYVQGTGTAPENLKKLRDQIFDEKTRYPTLWTYFVKIYARFFNLGGELSLIGQGVKQVAVDRAYETLNKMFNELPADNEVTQLQAELAESQRKYADVIRVLALEDRTQKINTIMLLEVLKRQGLKLDPEQEAKFELGEARVLQLMQENVTLREELQAANASLENCQTRLPESGSVNCKKQAIEARERIQQLEQTLEDTTTRHAAEVSELRTELNLQRRVCEEKIGDLDKLHNESRRKLRTEIERLTAFSNQQSQQIENAEIVNRELRDTVAANNKEILSKQTLLEDIANKNSEVLILSETNERLKKQNDELLVQISSPSFGADEQVTALNEKIASLAADLDQSRQSLSNLEGERNAISASRRDISAELEAKNTALEMNDVLLQQQKIQIETLQPLQTENTQLKSELTTLRETQSQLQGYLDQYATEIETKTRELREAQERIVNLLLKSGQLEQEHSDLVQIRLLYREQGETVNRLTRELSDLNERKRSLETELDIERAKNQLPPPTIPIGEPPEITQQQAVDQLLDAADLVNSDVLQECAAMKDKVGQQRARIEALTERLESLEEIPYVEFDNQLATQISSALGQIDTGDSFNPNAYLVLQARTFGIIFDRARQAPVVVEPAEFQALGQPMTLQQTVTRLAYSALVKQRVDGPYQLRLEFRDLTDARRLSLSANRLAPRVLYENAEPELVADVSQEAHALDYHFVTQYDRDLIPAQGVLRMARYNGALLEFEETVGEYKLRPPAIESPFGTEAVAVFEDGTRLYATYVTASLYALNLVVTPYTAM